MSLCILWLLISGDISAERGWSIARVGVTSTYLLCTEEGQLLGFDCLNKRAWTNKLRDFPKVLPSVLPSVLAGVAKRLLSGYSATTANSGQLAQCSYPLLNCALFYSIRSYCFHSLYTRRDETRRGNTKKDMTEQSRAAAAAQSQTYISEPPCLLSPTGPGMQRN